MQKVFKDCSILDKNCYERCGLTQDILMEHASLGMANYIKTNFPYGSKILIVAGKGNNGADGIVLARQLYGDYKINLFLPFELKSNQAKKQLQRAKNLGIKPTKKLNDDADIIVDAIFGAGLNKALDSDIEEILYKLNSFKGHKIACDIPTGLGSKEFSIAFKSDITLTMGAYKEVLFLDKSKDFVGKIECVNLGISSIFYQQSSDTYLLEKSDIKLPSRRDKNSHKGDFGHSVILAGEKEGAGILSAMASISFGAGLTTVVSNEKISLPPYLMQSNKIPQNTTALAIGMGMGNAFNKEFLKENIINSHIPIIIDADGLTHPFLSKLLKQKDREIVLTPHPKEFTTLWKNLTDEQLTVTQVQAKRFEIVRKFNEKYPNVTLLLKGANILIIQKEQLFINPLGTSVLSKGGSGDVLSGLIVSLLAQGYTSLDATIYASLSFGLASQNYNKSSYSLLPTELIEEVAKLENHY